MKLCRNFRSPFLFHCQELWSVEEKSRHKVLPEKKNLTDRFRDLLGPIIFLVKVKCLTLDTDLPSKSKWFGPKLIQQLMHHIVDLPVEMCLVFSFDTEFETRYDPPRSRPPFQWKILIFVKTDSIFRQLHFLVQAFSNNCSWKKGKKNCIN